jgi:xylulose-5-phosphate/fructose-6-phosphate phosphoketolase
LIHRLTYRRANHDNIHVRGYKEEGAITTPFDMTVLNDLDRFHLVMDAIDRLPQTGGKGVYLKQQLKEKLIEHKQSIDKNGETYPKSANGGGESNLSGGIRRAHRPPGLPSSEPHARPGRTRPPRR